MNTEFKIGDCLISENGAKYIVLDINIFSYKLHNIFLENIKVSRKFYRSIKDVEFWLKLNENNLGQEPKHPLTNVFK